MKIEFRGRTYWVSPRDSVFENGVYFSPGYIRRLLRLIEGKRIERSRTFDRWLKHLRKRRYVRLEGDKVHLTPAGVLAVVFALGCLHAVARTRRVAVRKRVEARKRLFSDLKRKRLELIDWNFLSLKVRGDSIGYTEILLVSPQDVLTFVWDGLVVDVKSSSKLGRMLARWCLDHLKVIWMLEDDFPVKIVKEFERCVS